MKFTIGFEKEDTRKLHEYWDDIIRNQQWSEGKFTEIFEEKWSEYNQLNSVSFSTWSGAALAVLEFFNVNRENGFVSFKYLYGNTSECYKGWWKG